MPERWVKYKSTIINISQIRTLRAHKIKSDMIDYYQKECGASKQKPWVLSADHDAIDAFANKEDAMNVAEDIATGKYDLKKD